MMPSGKCAHCGGRMLTTGDKIHGRIVSCQMCGKCPDAHPPTYDYEKVDAEAFSEERERAAELRRQRDRQRYRAKAAI